MKKSNSNRIVLHKTLCPSVSLSELFSARRESVRIIDEIDRAIVGLRGSGYDGLGKLELPDFDPTEPFHIEDSEPLESDRTKYDRYLMDGEWRKKEKVKTGGRTVKFDVEEEKEKLRILNKKLEFYKEVAFSIIMFLTMLSGVFFLVFAVIKLLS